MDKTPDAIMRELEEGGTRRCLVCAALNPCPKHSQADQRAELARNDAEIAQIRAERSTDQ